MSVQFNDLTNYKGLVQLYEKEIGVPRGTVSGDTDKLKDFTAEVNLTLDDFTRLAIEADGSAQYDDSNQTDYPIITTNLVSGQRDYNIGGTDGSGNLILEIFKVFVADSSGTYREILPVDVSGGNEGLQTPGNTSGVLGAPGLSSFTDGKNATGTPYRYDKLANGIFLDPIPSYNSTNGLKLYINREASYFASTDTTKKPGIPGIFHRYLVIVPAQRYAARKSMPIAGGRLRNGAFTGLLMEINDMEQEIQDYFGVRSRDERTRLTVGNDSTK